MDLAQSLANAISHHQAGRLDEAAAIYRALLKLQPHYPDALHLLGLIELRHHHVDDALALLQQAVALNPQAASFHLSLADALHALGRYDGAERACRAAIQLEPKQAEGHNHLGVMLKAQCFFTDD